MTRGKLIELVKVKLEEVSPFDISGSVLALGDSGEPVRPLLSYIESCLDTAGVYCLSDLPLSLLGRDIIHESRNCVIDSEGVGHVSEVDYSRWVRVSTRLWERSCTSFITTSDALYSVQQNSAVRGGVSKPVVVYSPEFRELELYSFPESSRELSMSIDVWCIPFYVDEITPRERSAESIQSAVGEYIALECGAMVLDILGNAAQASVLREEYKTKLSKVLP